jgi:hypothetical protein
MTRYGSYDLVMDEKFNQAGPEDRSKKTSSIRKKTPAYQLHDSLGGFLRRQVDFLIAPAPSRRMAEPFS